MPIFDSVVAVLAVSADRVGRAPADRGRALPRPPRIPAFTGGEVVLVVLICVIGSGMWEGRQHGIHFNTGGLDVFGETFDYPVSAQAPSAGITRVTFENPRGNLRITGGDTQDVVVNGRKMIRAWNRGDADNTNGTTPVEIVPQGDRLLIRTNQDTAPDPISGSPTISK